MPMPMNQCDASTEILVQLYLDNVDRANAMQRTLSYAAWDQTVRAAAKVDAAFFTDIQTRWPETVFTLVHDRQSRLFWEGGPCINKVRYILLDAILTVDKLPNLPDLADSRDWMLRRWFGFDLYRSLDEIMDSNIKLPRGWTYAIFNQDEKEIVANLKN